MKTSHFRNGFLLVTTFIVNSVFTSLNSFSQQAWIQVPTPDISATRNLLKGISGTSSSDVWTVGEYQSVSGGLNNLIMHWNGSGWQSYPGTDLGSNYNVLWDVAAISPNNIWAAGTYNDPGTSRSQLIHWNGSGWTHTSLPDIAGGSFLFSIDAIAANDIWAVGGQAGSPTDPPYAIHYNGSSWTEFPAANPGTYSNRFYSVDGIASNDVWAVGRQSNSYGDFHAMAQHWNGSCWTNSPLPAEVLAPIGDLESVTMISSDNVWALGSTITGGLIMIHWNGTSWSAMPTEGGSGGVISSREPDVFSLGYRISHWDGAAWTIIDSLNHLTFPTLVSSVTFPNGDIWAAGTTYDSYFHTLVYRTTSEPPLPVMIHYYSIMKTGSSATMRWSTASEFNTKEFVMERSFDGKQFMPVTSIAAHGSEYNYELRDLTPLPGLNYYRLKAIDWDGSVKTYPAKSLNFDNLELEPFNVYPNPVVGNVVNLWISSEGDFMLYLHDLRGKELMSRKVSGDVSSFQINLPFNMMPGVYTLSLVRGTTVWSEKIYIK